MTESERLTRREEDDLFSVYLRKALIERLADYEDIGTVSEFRELKEKATAKKVKGISLTHESRVGNCPYCHQFVMEKYDKSCPKCGTNLDWSEGKE